MPKTGSKLSWKIVGGLSTLAVAAAVRKVLTLLWRAVVGQEPPEKPEHPDVAWSHAVGWALLSGTSVALARLVVTRKAAEAWRRANGTLPPGLEETD